MKKHLTLRAEANRVVVSGDTYNAKAALAVAGFKAQKVGYEWQYVAHQDAKAAISKLAAELHRLAAGQPGFASRPYDFAWTLTVIAGGKEAHFFALENLVPARYEMGQLRPVQQ